VSLEFLDQAIREEKMVSRMGDVVVTRRVKGVREYEEWVHAMYGCCRLQDMDVDGEYGEDLTVTPTVTVSAACSPLTLKQPACWLKLCSLLVFFCFTISDQICSCLTGRCSRSQI